MSVLPCIVACVIAHGPLESASAAPAAPAAGGTVRFALHSQWFGPEFTIRPAVPGAGDVIQFTDPWGNRGGTNTCVAAGYWGDPRIVVDHEARQVRVEFIGGEFHLPVDRVCPTNVVDARGLIGQFGPLEAGRWTYQAGDLPAHAFTVVPEPEAGVTLAAAATLLGFRRRNAASDTGT
jgi:hypothetical protein